MSAVPPYQPRPESLGPSSEESDSTTLDQDVGNVTVTDYQINRIESRLSRVQSAAAVDSRPVDAEKPPLADHQPGHVRLITGFRWFAVCLSLYISCFLYGLDTTIAADVQGDVVEAFGRVDALAWIGAGFPLGSVSVILLLGALYTSFNMKWIYVAAYGLFLIGSALCGAAPNMNAMIVGRVIAGSGGSGVFLGCLNYFSALNTREELGLYISLCALSWGVGSVLGPVIGGAFSVSSATWRWAFYINLIIGGVTLPVVFLYLPPLHPVKGVPLMKRIANLDFVGFLLNIAMWVLFTFALTMAGGQWPWHDGRTITVFVVFGVVLVVYVLQQYFTIFTTKETRSFPGNLLKSRTQILLFVGTAANITSLFVVVYFVPVYFQFVHNDSALMAAVRLLPFVVVAMFFNVLIGHVLPRVKWYMPVYVVSGVFMTVGGALLTAYLDPSTPEANIYGFTVLIAVGTGLTLETGYTIASLKVPSEEAGDAISLQNVSQIGGTVIALVIAGQVFQSTAVRNLEAVLAGQGFSDGDIHAAVAGAQSALFEHLTGDLRAQAIAAITSAMQKSFVLVIVGGGMVLLSGLLMRVERLF